MIVVEAELWWICFCSAPPECSFHHGRQKIGKGKAADSENSNSGPTSENKIVCQTCEATRYGANPATPLRQAAYLPGFFVVGGFFSTPLVLISAK
jgi:hypothetical protein